jgi:hypothetical protein
MGWESNVLTYTFYINCSQGNVTLSKDTSMISYNMPITYYSLGNNYYERLTPEGNSFIQQGAAAPVCHVFVVEKVPINTVSYARIVAVPSIRALNYTVANQTNYLKLYLPDLQNATSPFHSQSLTFVGDSVEKYTYTNVTQINIAVTYHNGYGDTFFNFRRSIEILNSTSSPQISANGNTIVELYVGNVKFTVGEV